MPTSQPAPASQTNSSEASGPRRWDRVLLKLSGEAFTRAGEFGINAEELDLIATEVASAHGEGAELAVVVGGGNIIRGAALSTEGHIQRATADYMGMLGTVINALALGEKLRALGVDPRVMSALEIKSVAEPFIRGRALRHMEKGRVVILAAGTGNPFFSTDTCAALRAAELECEILMKATKVDGVYTADPKRDAGATRFERLTFQEAIERGLGVMDMTALTMCRENGVPVLVFEFKKAGNIKRAVSGEPVGTLVTVE